MESEKEGKCPNCRRSVPMSNMETHQSYCVRNCQLCDQCFQLVDNKSMESHKATHVRRCNLRCMAPSYCRHEVGCSMRPSSCRYCQMQVPNIELACHEQLCPQRCKPCRICGGEFAQNNYVAHVLKCQQNEQEVKQNNRIPYKPKHVPSEKYLRRITGGDRGEGTLNRKESNHSDASIEKECGSGDHLKSLNRMLQVHQQAGSAGKIQSRPRLPLPTPVSKSPVPQPNSQYQEKPISSKAPLQEEYISPVPVSIRYNEKDLHRCRLLQVLTGVQPAS